MPETNISPEINFPSQEQATPISATEMVRVSENIQTAYANEQEFLKSFIAKTEQAKVILEGWMHGEITLDQAAKIIAAQGSELEMALETDQLMDIPNRAALERIILEQIAFAKREGKPLSLAFIDLDKFGEINKTYENAAGDATLQAVGTFLKSELKRPTDKVGRRGGEELIVVLPETDETGAMNVLEDMRTKMPDSVAEIVKGIGEYVFDRPITMSAGLVTTKISQQDPRDSETIMEELINQADARMRIAKNNGRNQVVDESREKSLAVGDQNG